jgi:hypothetical protein
MALDAMPPKAYGEVSFRGFADERVDICMDSVAMFYYGRAPEEHLRNVVEVYLRGNESFWPDLPNPFEVKRP